MASRDLADLLPEVRAKIEAFIAAALKEGLDLKVICTLRSAEEQDELYAQGRTKPGAIVTHARAYQSYHNFGRAADIVPLDGKGDIWWKAPQETWAKFGDIAKRCGLVWGGEWPKGKVDLDHVEDSIGHPLVELRKELTQQQKQPDKPQTAVPSPPADSA